MALRGQRHSVPLVDDKGLLARHISTVAPTVGAPRTRSQPRQQRYDARPLDDKGTKYNIAKARGAIHKTPLQITSRRYEARLPNSLSKFQFHGRRTHAKSNPTSRTHDAPNPVPIHAYSRDQGGANAANTLSPPSFSLPSPFAFTNCPHMQTCPIQSSTDPHELWNNEHTPGGWHRKALASLTGTDPLTSPRRSSTLSQHAQGTFDHTAQSPRSLPHGHKRAQGTFDHTAQLPRSLPHGHKRASTLPHKHKLTAYRHTMGTRGAQTQPTRSRHATLLSTSLTLAFVDTLLYTSPLTAPHMRSHHIPHTAQSHSDDHSDWARFPGPQRTQRLPERHHQCKRARTTDPLINGATQLLSNAAPQAEKASCRLQRGGVLEVR